MKVLITGGCGFLGSNLAASYLQEGAEVTVIAPCSGVALLPIFSGWRINLLAVSSTSFKLIWLMLSA